MKIADMIDNVVVGELGVIRWRSNGQIPPEDCLQELEKWISFNRYLSSMIREEEDANFLARYKEQQKNRVHQMGSPCNGNLGCTFVHWIPNLLPTHYRYLGRE